MKCEYEKALKLALEAMRKLVVDMNSEGILENTPIGLYPAERKIIEAIRCAEDALAHPPDRQCGCQKCNLSFIKGKCMGTIRYITFREAYAGLRNKGLGVFQSAYVSFVWVLAGVKIEN